MAGGSRERLTRIGVRKILIVALLAPAAAGYQLFISSTFWLDGGGGIFEQNAYCRLFTGGDKKYYDFPACGKS